MAGVSTFPDTDFHPNFTECHGILLQPYIYDAATSMTMSLIGHWPAKNCFMLFINPILYGRGTVLSAVLIKCATLAAFVELHGNQTLSPLDLVGC